MTRKEFDSLPPGRHYIRIIDSTIVLHVPEIEESELIKSKAPCSVFDMGGSYIGNVIFLKSGIEIYRFAGGCRISGFTRYSTISLI